MLQGSDVTQTALPSVLVYSNTIERLRLQLTLDTNDHGAKEYVN
jgi:hypothetical protein